MHQENEFLLRLIMVLQQEQNGQIQRKNIALIILIMKEDAARLQIKVITQILQIILYMKMKENLGIHI